MPLFSRRLFSVPNAWVAFGHSYLMGAAGTLQQTGRTDALFRAALDIELSNWRNYAVSGSRLCMDGMLQGGWAAMYNETPKVSARAAPRAAEGGAMLLCYGINDIGNVANTSQVRTALQHAERAVISRWRASAVYEDTDATVAYGAGMTLVSNLPDVSSNGSRHEASSTTNANFTITLPADYKGETVVLSFIGMYGVIGGTVTFSGTAGITGTLSTSNIMPSGTGSRCPVVKRITTLTSANAGQTIIGTVTALDAGGVFAFDCWWLEALAAPAVVVCNIARLTAAGYTGNYGSWTGTEAAKDADVGNFNSDLVTLVAEFDSMVQIADIDSALNKDATLYGSDGLHPNEFGAAKCVDAIVAAQQRLTPTSTSAGATSNNPDNPQAGAVRRPRISTHWYTAESKGYGTNYTAVAGDMWAMPFMVSEAREKFNAFCVEAIASVTGTTVRWGIYGDFNTSGYPFRLIVEATFFDASGFTITTGAGVKTNAGGSQFSWQPDPGLYWLVPKFLTVGASHTFRTLAGPNPYMPSLATTGAGTIAPMGWKLTGQGTGNYPSKFPTGAALSDNVPFLGIQRA